jgi:hypothetical protein
VTEAEHLLEERAAIISEGCGVSQREGMRRALAQRAQEEACTPTSSASPRSSDRLDHLQGGEPSPRCRSGRAQAVR